MVSDLHKLRPSKVRNALRRRWFEYWLARIKLGDCASLLDLGTRYGGWTIPGDVVQSCWVCYCIGCGGDISFDLELIQRYGAKVRAFDAVAEYVELASAKTASEPRFTARQAAVSTSDGPVFMQLTHDPQSQSVSEAGLYESNNYIELPGRTLASLAKEFGDERIDLLKLDIEGGEYEVLPTLDLRAMGVKVFAVQLHHTASVRHARKLIGWLRSAGYEPVACRRTLKFTFLHRES